MPHLGAETLGSNMSEVNSRLPLSLPKSGGTAVCAPGGRQAQNGALLCKAIWRFSQCPNARGAMNTKAAGEEVLVWIPVSGIPSEGH